jgi:hypothetical protein
MDGVGCVRVWVFRFCEVVQLTHSLIVNMYVISLINHNSYSKNIILYVKIHTQSLTTRKKGAHNRVRPQHEIIYDDDCEEIRISTENHERC